MSFKFSIIEESKYDFHVYLFCISLSDVLDSDNLRVDAASMEFADSIASHFRHGRRSRLQIAEEEMRRRFQAGTHESRRHHGYVSEIMAECFCLFFLNLIYYRNSAF